LVSWQVQAFSKSDKVVTRGLEFRDGVRKNLMGSCFISLMVKGQDGRGMFGDGTVILSLALGDSGAGRIARVKVPEDDLLPTLVGNLTNKVVVAAIRRPHERGSDTQDPLESLVNAPHLTPDLVLVKGGEIRVRPRMGRDLVARFVGILDTLDAVSTIDTIIVVSVPEECSLGTSSDQGVGDILEINVRAIIKGQSDIVGFGAAADNLWH